MARIDNLTNYLTDVSQAIKDKKGDQTAIPAQNFDTEIANLPSGGNIDDYWDTNTPLTNNNKNLTGFITVIPLLDTSRLTSIAQMFINYSSLITIPLIDTSKVTNMNNTFNNCKALTSIPPLDTSKVTSAQYTFASCESLTTIPPLDIGQVTNMTSMFYDCEALQEINLNKAPILPNCDMRSAFYNVTSDCLIRVYDQASKDKVLASRSDLTNVVVEPYSGA